MLSVSRTDYFTRILVVTAMVWGFALPIAHLVCGMTVDSEGVMCGDHSMMDGAKDTAGHHAGAHGADLPCPTAQVEAGGDRIECCWIDATAVDRRAPLPSLTQMPDITAARTGLTPIVDAPDVRAIDRTTDIGTSPPIAVRLLFSVFLI